MMRHDRSVGVRAGRPASPAGRRSRALAATGAIAAVGVVLLAAATGGVSGAQAVPTYSAQATATGAEVDLFGTEVTGGSATVSVDTASPSVTAEGSGTLTPGLVEDQKAAVSADGQSQDRPDSCAQGGGTPAGLPVGVTLGLACASASAGLSAANVPDATASGTLASLDVNVAGLLNQIVHSGGDQLFTALQSVLGQLNASLGTGTVSCPGTAGSSAGATGPAGLGTLTSVLGSNAGASALGSLLGTLGSVPSPLSSLLGSLGLGGSGDPLAGLAGLAGSAGGLGGLGGASGLAASAGGLAGAAGTGSTGLSSPTGVLGTLLEGLCQTLTNIETVVDSASAPDTVVVDVGPATAAIVGSGPDAATATSEGATLDVQILPGVGCTASLAQCVADPTANAAPLVEVKVADARSSDTLDGGSWSPAGTGSVAEIDLNIPGFAQTISLAAGQSQDLLAGTPLETDIDLGSASTSGTAGTADGATVDLLKGVDGGVLLNLGSTSVTGTPATTSAVTSPSGGGTAGPSSGPVVAAASGAAVPTAVHTGEFWAGSLPVLVGLGGLGGGLVAWPRLRRTRMAARLLGRARR